MVVTPRRITLGLAVSLAAAIAWSILGHGDAREPGAVANPKTGNDAGNEFFAV